MNPFLVALVVMNMNSPTYYSDQPVTSISIQPETVQWMAVNCLLNNKADCVIPAKTFLNSLNSQVFIPQWKLTPKKNGGATLDLRASLKCQERMESIRTHQVIVVNQENKRYTRDTLSKEEVAVICLGNKVVMSALDRVSADGDIVSGDPRMRNALSPESVKSLATLSGKIQSLEGFHWKTKGKEVNEMYWEKSIFGDSYMKRNGVVLDRFEIQIREL